MIRTRVAREARDEARGRRAAQLQGHGVHGSNNLSDTSNNPGTLTTIRTQIAREARDEARGRRDRPTVRSRRPRHQSLSAAQKPWDPNQDPHPGRVRGL